MLSKVTGPLLTAVALAGTVLSLVVPWAHYGGIEIPLQRFPGWVGYLVGAIVLYGSAIWILLARDSRRRVVITVAVTGVFTIGYAAFLMSRYDDPEALFDSSIIPLVMPRLGIGGPVGIVSAFLGMAGVLACVRGVRRGNADG